MINAIFFKNNNFYYSFCVEGHAGYDTNGKDIVCAAVSSAIDMTIDAVKNIVGEKIDIYIDELVATVNFRLVNQDNEVSSMFIKSLCNHLINISKAYPDNIDVKIKSL